MAMSAEMVIVRKYFARQGLAGPTVAQADMVIEALREAGRLVTSDVEFQNLADEYDYLPASVAQRLKDERNEARAEAMRLKEAQVKWQADLDQANRTIENLMESAATWEAAARGHVETIEEMQRNASTG